MTPPPPPFSNVPDPDFDRVSRAGGARRLPDVLGELHLDAAPGTGAPDLTRKVMGRLGYMKAHRRVARREFVSRWAQRSGLVMIAGLTMLIGMQVFRHSDAARTPSTRLGSGGNGTTIPAALSEDVARQRDRLERLQDSIRSIASPRQPGQGNPDRDGAVEGGDEGGNPGPIPEQWLAVGPVRWM